MPLAPVLTKFSTAPAAVASYSSEELASGISRVAFYAVIGRDPDGVVNGLTENQVGSYPVETNVTDTTTVFTFTSAPFNNPRYAQGSAYATVNFYQQSGSGHVTAKLQHWDGTSATDLTGTATSNTLTADPERGTLYVELPITTEKNFASGDMLRLVLSVVATSGLTSFGHDPANTAGTLNTQGTRLEVGMSFRRDD